MPIVEILAKRPRSRALVAEVAAAVAPAAGCAPRDVWVVVVDIDWSGTGDDDAPCGPTVVVRGAPRDDPSRRAVLEATARAVASVQGEPLEQVSVDWIDVPASHAYGPPRA